MLQSAGVYITLITSLSPQLGFSQPKIKHGYEAVRICGGVCRCKLRWGEEHSRHGTVAVLQYITAADEDEFFYLAGKVPPVYPYATDAGATNSVTREASKRYFA